MEDFELQDELQALQLGTTEIEHDHDFSSEDPERLLEGQQDPIHVTKVLPLISLMQLR
jgi:hypothetical protein